MIDGEKFIERVKQFFAFLITEFEFKLFKETVNGNVFYDVEYHHPQRTVSISYENIENYLEVIIFQLENGKIPDYDDKEHTFHIHELNKKVLSKIGKVEIEINNLEFEAFNAKNQLERKLLKSAKELRLVLKYWHKIK